MNKKILLLSLISMFMISMTFGALTDNDIQFATFNDADLSGSNPIDVTGTGNTMVNNGATTGVAGLIDEAFSFDGNNDYMTLSKPVDPTPTANMTISLWIKTSTSCATNECYLITNDLSGSPDFTIGIGNTAIGGNKIFFASNNFVNIITSTSTVNDNGWHHIVATKNLANGSLWLDGVYQGSFTNAAAWTTGQNWEMANFRQIAGYYYTGLIDAYGVWDRTLTETEITNLYNGGLGLEYPFVTGLEITTNLTNGQYFNSEKVSIEVNTSEQSDAMFYYLNNTNRIIEDGLIGYYSFDGDFNDSSGQGNDGVETGTIIVNDTNMLNYGLQSNFDGLDDIITITNTYNYPTETITFWAKREECGVGDRSVFSYNNAYNQRNWFDFTQNSIKVRYTISGTSREFSVSNTCDTNWHFYSTQFNGTHLNIWKDNSLIKSDSTYSGTISSTSTSLILGRTGSFGGLYFNGSLDEFRVYNRSLSMSEVELLYNESPYTKMCEDCNTTTANLTNLQEASYNISFLATLSDSISRLDQYFNIDFTPPLINNTLPPEINSYFLNISNYVSCSDPMVLKSCNITFQPDGNTVLVNQTGLYNFTYNGNQSYNIIAEDQAGNVINESGVILVNPIAYFQFNNSGTLLTDYTFGGTLWTNTTAKFTLYNSVLTVGTNNSIEFSKVGYITQTFTQEVLNTSRINTTYDVSEAEIIVTIRNKDTLSQITGTNFTLSFIGNTGFTTTTITGNKTITGLLSAGNYELIVSSTPYTTESNFFTFSNQELLELTVYVANSSTNGFIIIEATGTSGELAVGATVQALQWNGFSYIVVSEGTTDTSGKATLNVILNTKSYQFKLIENGNSITSPAETITTDENGKTVPLSLQTGGITYNAIIDNYLINSTETYNNLTNISNIVMDWNSRDGTDMVACINVYTLLNDVERLSQSFCSNASSSGRMTKNFLINSSQFTKIKTELLLSNSYYTYQIYKYSPTLSFQNALLTYGFYFFVMLILYLVSIWAGISLFDNIYIALMLVIVSGFIGYSLVPSVITNLVATSFGLMGSLTIWVGYKKK